MPFCVGWRRAQLNSWPAPRTVLLDGWVIRLAGGYTRRANSATPLNRCRAPYAAQLASVAALYSAQGQPALVRVRSFDDPALRQALCDAAWAKGGTSTVLGSRLRPKATINPGVELFEGAPPAEWRSCPPFRGRPGETGPHPGYAGVPFASAGLRVEGVHSPYAACALVGVHDRVACLHLVVTEPAQRRRGLSRRLIASLLAWAQSRNAADAASLQVDSENAPALALYAGLGFDTTMFGYSY